MFLAFLGQFRFWMGIIWVARWNGLEILIPKHMWKSKIGPLEAEWDKNQESTLFRDTLYVENIEQVICKHSDGDEIIGLNVIVI